MGINEERAFCCPVTVSSPVKDLIRTLSKLPGVGPRLAQRMVLFILKDHQRLLDQLLADLQAVKEQVHTCSICGNLDASQPCRLCTSPERDSALLCVVETVADVWTLERAHVFHGRYHVLGGCLSAMDNVGPEQLALSALLRRMQETSFQEVVIALSSTLEGQSTAFYVADLISPWAPKITFLAQGVPMGGELNYLDDATLSAAFMDRRLAPRTSTPSSSEPSADWSIAV